MMATVAVKERPILFSGPMVRAILEGRKTQTRRGVELPHQNPLGQWEPTTWGGEGLYKDKCCTIPANEPEQAAIWHTRTGDLFTCSYGVPGDRLWVRETWAWPGEEFVLYRADPEACRMAEQFAANKNYPQIIWKPSIHLRRMHSRITLEITDVRVQRVQEISEEDAAAEGIWAKDYGAVGPVPAGRAFYWGNQTGPDQHGGFDSARQCFECLWDSINAKRGFGWGSNPWVWAISFRRVS